MAAVGEWLMGELAAVRRERASKPCDECAVWLCCVPEWVAIHEERADPRGVGFGQEVVCGSTYLLLGLLALPLWWGASCGAMMGLCACCSAPECCTRRRIEA